MLSLALLLAWPPYGFDALFNVDDRSSPDFVMNLERLNHREILNGNHLPNCFFPTAHVIGFLIVVLAIVGEIFTLKKYGLKLCRPSNLFMVCFFLLMSLSTANAKEIICSNIDTPFCTTINQTIAYAADLNLKEITKATVGFKIVELEMETITSKAFGKLIEIHNSNGPALEITGNNFLKNITLPSLKLNGTLAIMNNLSLEKVIVGNLTGIDGGLDLDINVENNPQLQCSSIKALRRISKNKNIAMCSFPSPMTYLGNLTGCGYIQGNLTIANDATGKADCPLSLVNGFVDLGNLEEDKALFLKNTIVTGTISSRLCHFNFSSLSRISKNFQPAELKKCTFNQKLKDVSELEGCQFIEGNLIFDEGVNGTKVETKLCNVTGDVHLAGLKEFEALFLEGTTVDGTVSSSTCEFHYDGLSKVFKTLPTDPCLYPPPLQPLDEFGYFDHYEFWLYGLVSLVFTVGSCSLGWVIGLVVVSRYHEYDRVRNDPMYQMSPWEWERRYRRVLLDPYQ